MRRKRQTRGKITDRFCIHEHDTFICGRYKDGKCKKCVLKRQHKSYIPHPCKPKQFCLKGHDTFVTGRDKGSACRECRREKKRKYKPGERPKKQFCLKGHDTFVCGRQKNGSCKVCDKKRSRRYYWKHRKEQQEKRKKYAAKHLKRIRKAKRIYYIEHRLERKEYRSRPEVKQHRNKMVNEKLKVDPMFKLITYLRNRLYAAIRKNQKRGSAVRDLGCSIPFLKGYIEAKFYGGMTWKNWGAVWELDHKKALFKFDLTKRSQLLRAVNYTNLQPLTIKDHQKKSAKEALERSKLRRKNAR